MALGILYHIFLTLKLLKQTTVDKMRYFNAKSSCGTEIIDIWIRTTAALPSGQFNCKSNGKIISDPNVKMLR